MREIRIEKVTLNIGAGKDQAKLEKGVQLLKTITGRTPVTTYTNKRIPEWSLRPGLPIGCKVTLRGEKTADLLKKLFSAKDNLLKISQFDKFGNLSFGIHEYIDIPGIKYEPKIGIIGLEVSVTLERPGYRIKRRSLAKKRVGKRHLITKEDAIEFLKREFNVNVSGEEE